MVSNEARRAAHPDRVIAASPPDIRPDHDPDHAVKIAICALTFMRPSGLERLLDHLDRIDVPAGVDVATFIVDNDPERSAEPVVIAHRERSAWPIEYVAEATRGISAGRNRSIREALDWGADFVCWLDDDEWPDPAWLTEFVETQRATHADAVTGPVFPVFDETPPGWVTDGKFFDRPRFEHNAEIGWATTSTVMVATSAIDGWPDPFDHEFGLSGGSDTHFFAQLRDRGGTIAWSDRSHVYEAIPATRVDTRWLLRREYRRGQTLSRSMVRRTPTPIRYVRRVANATVQVLRGAALTVVFLPFGKARWLHGVKGIMLGAGMVSGLLGRRYDEYRTIHGG